MKNLGSLIPFLFVFILGLSLAQAEVVEDTCRVARPLLPGSNGDGDTYYTLFLACNQVAPMEPPFVTAYAPSQPLARLNELLQSQAPVKFKFQNGFPGVVIAIEGIDVGHLTPEADRKISAIEVQAFGQPASDLILNILDDKKIAKIPRIDSCQNQQLQTYGRTVKFTAVNSELSVSVSESGPHLTKYGSRCQHGDGSTLISIQGRVVKGKNFVRGDQLALDPADSMNLSEFLRSAFSSGQNKTVQVGRITIQCENGLCVIQNK